MSKGKAIFRGGMISEGIVSGKNEIELISGTGIIDIGKNYLSDTFFDINLQSANEMSFRIDNSMLGNTYTFYISNSPGVVTGAFLDFRPRVIGATFYGLASCSDGNLEIRNESIVTINEGRYLRGCIITVRLVSANQISINIVSPDESSKITTS
tara:strand:+ start:1975 stop:2436 length:462 start_codon:yes stop_codon:yes gene_type:complete